MEHNLKPLQFVLKGFGQLPGYRVFLFDGIGADHARTEFTVKADLALLQRYGIRLQELPLLCRAVLERGHEGASQKRAFAYTEDEMKSHAADSAARAEAAKQRKPPRKPVGGRLGSAWRGTPAP